MIAARRAAPARRARRLLPLLLVAYLLALGLSFVVRRFGHDPSAPDGPAVEVQAVDGGRRTERSVSVAYRDAGSAEDPTAPVLLLLHGSPGSQDDFRAMLGVLGRRRRVVAPDFPGFGGSTRDVPDYSVRAHADYVLQLIDRLGIDRVHVVGFSMGGGVGLRLYELAPDRVASMTLLSAIGVQELELFGDYRMNRLIHGAQLALIWSAREALPHFGWLDDAFLGVPYARNFYDTDQRPLRQVLLRFRPPMLIIHGQDDFLVPVEAALEHHRLVPQSELLVLPASHFIVFLDGPRTAERIVAFVDRVDAGLAPSRSDATAERRAASRAPFDPRDAPPFTGFAMILTMGLIALATLVSEDLSCIGSGLLVGQGRLEFLPAVIACLIGIFVGDMLLFLAGRLLGRPALRRAPMRWVVHEEHVASASQWFGERGPAVILASRFLPGMRLPTYFAAGMLRTSLLRFSLYFLLAVSLWTPLLVGLAALVGERAFGYFEFFQRHVLVALVLLALWILAVVKLLVPLFSYRGRRRLYGRLRRLWNWEFWPPWVFYPPVLLYVLWLGLRHRGLLLFTAANPAIPAGGFIAESKYAILEGLAGAGNFVARTCLVPPGSDTRQRIERVRRFMQDNGLDYPIVLKPDAGQRGSGVAIVRDDARLESYLEGAIYESLAQEYAPGDEFGVFYYRLPGEAAGRIFSVTEKRIPTVTGDGRRTIEELILDDRRAVCMLDHYLRQQAGQAGRVPDRGETVPLVELGTHCRGAIFLDGEHRVTDELIARIDQISRGYEGFYFGRYDVRAVDVEQLRRGSGFKIIELNGVTSEATHIYDPRLGLRRAYRTLFEQWRIAFEIGARNRARGVAPARAAELLRLIRRYRRLARDHPE